MYKVCQTEQSTKRQRELEQGLLQLKIEQCSELTKSDVNIGDVAKLGCTDQTVVNRLKTEKLFSVKKRKVLLLK